MFSQKFEGSNFPGRQTQTSTVSPLAPTVWNFNNVIWDASRHVTFKITVKRGQSFVGITQLFFCRKKAIHWGCSHQVLFLFILTEVVSWKPAVFFLTPTLQWHQCVRARGRNSWWSSVEDGGERSGLLCWWILHLRIIADNAGRNTKIFLSSTEPFLVFPFEKESSDASRR